MLNCSGVYTYEGQQGAGSPKAFKIQALAEGPRKSFQIPVADLDVHGQRAVASARASRVRVPAAGELPYGGQPGDDTCPPGSGRRRDRPNAAGRAALHQVRWRCVNETYGVGPNTLKPQEYSELDSALVTLTIKPCCRDLTRSSRIKQLKLVDVSFPRFDCPLIFHRAPLQLQ